MTFGLNFSLAHITELFDSHKLLIFFVPFLIYVVNGREISSGDPTPTVFTSINLVKKGTVFLDDLHDYIPYHNMPYYVSEQCGHIVSNYPVFPGVMAAPVFAPFVWLGMVEPGDGDLVWNYLSKLSGAFYSSLAVLVMFLALKLLIDKENALLLAMAYGLGTALWPIASQSLWQHGPSVFWWSVCFYAIIRAEQSDESCVMKRFLFFAGMAAGCAVLCRTVNGVCMAVMCGAILLRHRRCAMYFIVPAAVLSALLIIYNVALFDSWKGGDTVLHALHWELDRVEGDSWSTPLYIGLPGQLISPSRGLLIFSPFLIFSFIGMIVIWRKEESVWRTIALTIPAPLLMLLLFSKYAVWWGGNSHFGPRYQIETYPFLIIYMAAILPALRKHRLFNVLFIVLLIYSVIVQWVGAFCYPGGWTVEPVDLAHDKARFWSWSYNQIWTCLKSGIKFPGLW